MRLGYAVASVAACIVLTARAAGAQTKGSNDSLDSYEAMIVWSIHQVNQDQIEAGKLAQTNGSSTAVKSFADTLVQDHGSEESQVEAYAQRHAVDLGALGRRVAGMSPDQVELERRARSVGSASGEWAWTWEHDVRATRAARPALDKLRRLNGADFDREYVRLVRNEHQDLTDLLAQVGSRTSDAELKSLVDGILPTCRQHLATAQQLQTGVAKGY
jgi:predicted outer membrane protein